MKWRWGTNMKITKAKLKEIIKEELQKESNGGPEDLYSAVFSANSALEDILDAIDNDNFDDLSEAVYEAREDILEASELLKNSLAVIKQG